MAPSEKRQSSINNKSIICLFGVVFLFLPWHFALMCKYVLTSMRQHEWPIRMLAILFVLVSC